MSYKILPNAKVLMSTDGTERLFVDTGSKVVPVGAEPPIRINLLDYGVDVLALFVKGGGR